MDKEISGGAKVKQLFNLLYEKYASNEYRATINYKDEDIKKAIVLHQGDSIPGFPSIDAFLYLVQPQLELIKEPALQCLQDVFLYLDNLAASIIQKTF